MIRTYFQEQRKWECFFINIRISIKKRQHWTCRHLDMQTFGHADIWTCRHLDMQTFFSMQTFAENHPAFLKLPIDSHYSNSLEEESKKVSLLFFRDYI